MMQLENSDGGDPEGVKLLELISGRHSRVSTQDTVVNAGKFDGALGIISAISAVKVLKVINKLEMLKRPIEVNIFLVLKFEMYVKYLKESHDPGRYLAFQWLFTLISSV
ncbi:hypothetical protein RND81_05G089000 [Saponaria officinalis]|uniref:Uncharacterized protein n=1 Tax=Saponaria officinalis TaxID=3572 RepID=A0AAW1KVI2_SAPOF